MTNFIPHGDIHSSNVMDDAVSNCVVCDLGGTDLEYANIITVDQNCIAVVVLNCITVYRTA